MEKELVLNTKQTQMWNMMFDGEGNLRTDHNYNHFAFFGAFRCGKSFFMMLATLVLCKRYSGCNASMIRMTYGELTDSCIVQFLEAFPPEENDYVYKTGTREIIFNNKSRLTFRAFDTDSKIKSNNYDFVVLVQAEEIYESLYLQLIGRLSGQAIPRPLILTEGNPADCHLKDLYIDSTKEFREENGIYFISGETADNKGNLPDNYIENLKRNYPEDYLDRYLYGGWNKTSDRVYTAMQDFHKIRDVPVQSHWFKCVGFDHGIVNDSAAVFCAKDEYGNIYVFDEWKKKGATLEDIHAACVTWGNLPVVADFSMKSGRVDAASLWEDLLNLGLQLIECTKDKTANILLVNQAFHRNELKIMESCEYTWGQHKRYQYKKASMTGTENRKEQVRKFDDHSVDALQYAVRYMKDIKVQSRDAFEMGYNQPTLKEIVTKKGV
jgi:phage terminase large subunit